MRKDFQIVGGREAEQGDPTPVIETEQPVAPGAAISTQPGVNGAQVVLAIAATLFVLYFGKLPIVVLLVSALLAFVLEPLVGTLERWMPRVLAASVAIAVFTVVLYTASYYSYLKAKDFVADLPKYSGQIKQQVVRFRQQANKIAETGKQIVPQDADEKDAVKVKQVHPLFSTESGGVTETVVAISFVPFLVFFMLTWQEHIRASLVQLFRRENRTTAYVALSHISKMLRAFIAGNFVIGLATGVLSAVLFWWLEIPYWYFVGPISGFVSLIPYLGVPLAILPPVAAGITTLKPSGFFFVATGVVIFHLFALNVLYPKVLGSRLQLNPLVVTASLLIWGFLWGAVGLVLAIPLTAAMKIAFEHIDSLQPLSHLLGEGDETA